MNNQRPLFSSLPRSDNRRISDAIFQRMSAIETGTRREAKKRGKALRIHQSTIAGIGLLALIFPGCAGGSVNFTMAEIRLGSASTRSSVVQFDAAVSANGYSGQQLVYRVTLEDRSGNPILSQDGKYQLPDGQVACARTFMVHGSIFLEDITAAIPINQLEVSKSQFPVLANFGIYLPTGETLATHQRSLPLEVLNRGGYLTRSWSPSHNYDR